MSRIEFIEAGMQNFVSYGNNLTTVPLQLLEPTLIVGKNYDSEVNGQVDSNGAGKTTILNAVTFTLFGKPLTKFKSLNDLINNTNKKDLYTYVILKANGKYYKIERFRKHKVYGGDGVFVSEGSKLKDLENKGISEDKTPDSIDNTNTFIAENIVKMDYEVFTRIIVFSATNASFLSLPVTSTTTVSQRSIIEQLFNFQELTKKAKKLKDELKDDKKDFKSLQETQKVFEKYKESFDKQREDLEQSIKDWDDDKNHKLSILEGKLKELSSVDIKSQKKLFSRLEAINTKFPDVKSKREILANKIDSLTKEYNAKESEKISLNKKMSTIEEDLLEFRSVDIQKELNSIEIYENYTSELNEANQKFEYIKEGLSNHLKKEEELKKELKALDENKCPYCEQHMDAEEKRNIVNKDYAFLEDEIMSCETIYLNRKKELKKIKESTPDKPKFSKSDLDRMTINIENSEKLLAELKEAFNLNKEYNYGGIGLEIDSLKIDKEDLDKEYSELSEKLSSVKKNLEFDSVDELNTIANSIESYNGKIEDLNESTNPHINLLDNLEEVDMSDDKSEKINELSDTIKHKDFLVKLLSSNDSFIRKTLLKDNIPLLNERVNIYLKMIGLPHYVAFNEALKCEVSQFGKVIPHEALSNGQKARINIALAFAFRDILQYKHGFVNLCLIDEALDVGLGNVGVQLVAKMIKNIAKDNDISMFVISHRDEVTAYFNSIMTIELKDGFSDLVIN